MSEEDLVMIEWLKNASDEEILKEMEIADREFFRWRPERKKHIGRGTGEF